ncbi:rab-interacting lysosomal protein isoform X2 [Alligator mississippiensis]|uniref:rab-interacting lysosomal protein isoform X2 n=1 Tax=Alligator mississippiensis TaxID=8496 RepID=UPI002877FCF8|nr:rab-interacting lysosomal protein isoform X2 [Alligator mississippiensis]
MAEALWLTPAARLAPGHVYRMAGALGAELQRLSGRFGAEAVCGLVPQVVRLLELLEALVGPAEPQPEAESEAGAGGGPEPGAEPALRARLAALQDESRELRARLARSRAHEDSTVRQERDVMLRLKEVVDKQRDELRAQAHEILCRSRDTEALQEQLTRFMSMNEDLRNKLAVTQAQLRAALEKNGDAETAAPPSRREQERPASTVPAVDAPGPSAAGVTVPGEELQPPGRATSSADRGFSKEELQQILQERNELKTSLFLVREELAYYQREVLNQEHVPGLLLDAMKSVVKRQRKKIRAKMLGTVDEPASSDDDDDDDDDDKGSWLPAPEAGSVGAQTPGSKIRSFFGLWYRGSSSSDASRPGSAAAWEIIDSQDVCAEQDGSEPAAHSPAEPASE